MVRIGTAGWSVPLALADRFPTSGTGLERYSAIFPCAEINSSFHRTHGRATYARWAAAVPDGFLFSAKLAKTITHQNRLIDCGPLLDTFFEGVTELGPKLAIILVQLPPSLQFDPTVLAPFFDSLRERSRHQLVCEPRHASWFEEEADSLLQHYQVARVAADPARTPGAAVPGGWMGLTYRRLHGSPVPYRSSYDDGRLERYAAAIRADLGQGRPSWCIFDNTASSAAAGDALKLIDLL